MDAIRITIPPGGFTPEQEEALSELRRQGHGLELVEAGHAAPAVDPLAGLDLDKVPDQLFVALGISKEEVRRHREAAPAVEHGRNRATDPAGPDAGPLAAPPSGDDW